jgi:hypothetical protein
MNLERISHLTTSSLNGRPSRRDVIRGLLGTGLGLAALRLPEAVEAKKRKKRKKRKNGGTGQTCEPGTSIGSVRVPATGADVRSPVLDQGQRYRMRATGFWYTNPTYGADAFASFPLVNPSAPVTTYQGVRVGLSVDGGSPDEWGNYNITHNYEREVVGQGKTLTLKYTDPVTTDNSGSLIVDFVCA